MMLTSGQLYGFDADVIATNKEWDVLDYEIRDTVSISTERVMMFLEREPVENGGPVILCAYIFLLDDRKIRFYGNPDGIFCPYIPAN